MHIFILHPMMWLLIIKVNVDKGPYLIQRQAPKNGKRKTFETVSTQELCKYLVCIKQCCWQGGQIFSCWLLWTFDPNSPPRIPEHTTSKSNSMTTDYFLINLMMNHTNNKYTKKCRHDTLRLWTQLIDKSVKLSKKEEKGQTDIGEFKIMAAPPCPGLQAIYRKFLGY